MDYGIRLTFRASLTEAADAAQIPTQRGWKQGESDHQTVAYTNSFANEQTFQAELTGLKAALGNRIKSIEYLGSTDNAKANRA